MKTCLGIHLSSTIRNRSLFTRIWMFLSFLWGKSKKRQTSKDNQEHPENQDLNFLFKTYYSNLGGVTKTAKWIKIWTSTQNSINWNDHRVSYMMLFDLFFGFLWPRHLCKLHVSLENVLNLFLDFPGPKMFMNCKRTQIWHLTVSV